MLTGELPFRGNTRMLILQILNEEPPSPRKINPAISRDLETIVLRCLEKDPARRYATAREVAEELQRCTGIGRVITGEDLDQRRLARAVVAQQAVDLARADREVDAIERPGAAETLRQPAQRECGPALEPGLGHFARPQSLRKPAT